MTHFSDREIKTLPKPGSWDNRTLVCDWTVRASGSLEATHGSELGSSACRNGSEEEAIALPTWPLLPLLKGSLHLCQIKLAACHTLPSVFPDGRVNVDRWVAGAEVG